MNMFEKTPREHLEFSLRELIRRAARDVYGAAWTETPIEGYQTLTRPGLDDPLAGVRAAALTRAIAQSHIGEYARQARGAGTSWAELGEALGIERGDEYGPAAGELAFRHLVEREPLPTSVRYGGRFDRSSTYWRCTGCGQLVTDRGPFEPHPADNESGHAAGCARHATEIAAYHRQVGDAE